MKKIISMILALVLVVGGMFALTSCGSDPELDFAALRSAFEKANDNICKVNAYNPENPKTSSNIALYQIEEVTNPSDPSLEKYMLITRSNPDDSGFYEFLYVYVYNDSSSAKVKLADIERQREADKERLEAEIAICEHFLEEEYAAKLTADQKKMYTDNLAKYKSDLIFIDYTSCGRDGNVVWYGTEVAITQSKL